jgi:hypothetical protein
MYIIPALHTDDKPVKMSDLRLCDWSAMYRSSRTDWMDMRYVGWKKEINRLL